MSRGADPARRSRRWRRRSAPIGGEERARTRWFGPDGRTEPRSCCVVAPKLTAPSNPVVTKRGVVGCERDALDVSHRERAAAGSARRSRRRRRRRRRACRRADGRPSGATVLLRAPANASPSWLDEGRAHDATRHEIHEEHRGLRAAGGARRDHDDATAVGCDGEHVAAGPDRHGLSSDRGERRGVEHDEALVVAACPRRRSAAPRPRAVGSEDGLLLHGTLRTRSLLADGEDGTGLPIPES